MSGKSGHWLHLSGETELGQEADCPLSVFTRCKWTHCFCLPLCGVRPFLKFILNSDFITGSVSGLSSIGVSAFDQRIPRGTESVLQRFVTIQPLKGAVIEKLTPGEQLAVDGGFAA